MFVKQHSELRTDKTHSRRLKRTEFQLQVHTTRHYTKTKMKLTPRFLFRSLLVYYCSIYLLWSSSIEPVVWAGCKNIWNMLKSRSNRDYELRWYAKFCNTLFTDCLIQFDLLQSRTDSWARRNFNGRASVSKRQRRYLNHSIVLKFALALISHLRCTTILQQLKLSSMEGALHHALSNTTCKIIHFHFFIFYKKIWHNVA